MESLAPRPRVDVAIRLAAMDRRELMWCGGKNITDVVVAQRDGRFVIGVRELASGDEILVSDGPKDDSPSFAPNSKWIIFSSRINGREALSAVSVDGKVRTRISLDTAGIRNPAWGQMPR